MKKLIIASIIYALICNCIVLSGEKNEKQTVMPRSQREKRLLGYLFEDIQDGSAKEVINRINNNPQLLDMQDASGSTALITAAVWGKPDITQQLIELGAQLNLQDNNGETALLHAIVDPSATTTHEVYTTIAQRLIDAGADLTLENNGGQTALDKATAKNNHAVLKHIQQKKIKS
jgi:ankyrin repeat protein